jgi:N-acetylmuramoyl-L-alanine amidase
VNLALYHYAGNNPVKYTDPDGRKDTIVVSPGHGIMLKDAKGQLYESTGLRGPVNGYWEISHIYNFQQKLIPELQKQGFNVINIKAPPYNAYTASDKINASNEIYDSIGVALHIAIHADVRGEKGFDGVTVLYMTGRTRSQSIAQHYVDALIAAGIMAKAVPDKLSGPKFLGELWKTKAPAVYFEIGNQQSESGLNLLLDKKYLQKMAEVIAYATKTLLE